MTCDDQKGWHLGGQCARCTRASFLSGRIGSLGKLRPHRSRGQRGKGVHLWKSGGGPNQGRDRRFLLDVVAGPISCRTVALGAELRPRLAQDWPSWATLWPIIDRSASAPSGARQQCTRASVAGAGARSSATRRCPSSWTARSRARAHPRPRPPVAPPARARPLAICLVTC